MYGFKKKITAVLSGAFMIVVLAIAATTPSVSKAADSASGDSKDLGFEAIVTEDEITVKGLKKVYVDTVKNGKVKAAEVYRYDGVDISDGKKSISIDLSYINGRGTELWIYAEKDAPVLKVIVEKQAKTRAKFNAKIKEMTDVSGGEGDYYVDIGNEYDVIDFDKYMVKGAVAYVYYPASIAPSGIKNKWITSEMEVTITPESKRAKVKIPAKAKGPKIAFDMETLSFKLPKDCTYNVTQTGKGAAATSGGLENKEISTGNITGETGKISITQTNEKIAAKNIDITEGDITIEMWRNSVGNKPESKISELVIPRQKNAAEVDGGGISWSYKTKSKKVSVKNEETGKMEKVTVQEPVAKILKNETGKVCQIAIVPSNTDIGKIDLIGANPKIKWKNVKPNGSVAYKLDSLNGNMVIYRIKGEKASKANNNTMTLPSTIEDVDISDTSVIEEPENNAEIGELIVNVSQPSTADTSLGTLISVDNPKMYFAYKYRVVGAGDAVIVPSSLDDVKDWTKYRNGNNSQTMESIKNGALVTGSSIVPGAKIQVCEVNAARILRYGVTKELTADDIK